MLKDFNKDMVTYTNSNGVAYNHLNLIQTVTVKKDAATNKGTITYTYDAAGNKLSKTTVEGSTTTTTLYVAGAVYINDALQFIAHEEGKVRLSPLPAVGGGYLVFDYFIKDHLGNTRMVLTEEQQTDAYPVASFFPATSP